MCSPLESPLPQPSAKESLLCTCVDCHWPLLVAPSIAPTINWFLVSKFCFRVPFLIPLTPHSISQNLKTVLNVSISSSFFLRGITSLVYLCSVEGAPPGFDSTHVCFKFNVLYEEAPGWKEDSMLKRMYYPSKGPEFSLQHPHYVVHSHLDHQLQGYPMPLVSSIHDLQPPWAHAPTCTNTHMYIHTCRIRNNEK